MRILKTSPFTAPPTSPAPPAEFLSLFGISFSFHEIRSATVRRGAARPQTSANDTISIQPRRVVKARIIKMPADESSAPALPHGGGPDEEDAGDSLSFIRRVDLFDRG